MIELDKTLRFEGFEQAFKKLDGLRPALLIENEDPGAATVDLLSN